eukprot:5445646-Ditylum_brightwellii.AAC.1
MSYGWIIANADEEILAKQAGPAYGKATSFQAEGYGLLLIAASTLKMWGKHQQITHIKSQQDNVTMANNLDFPVQLNVAAD